MVDETVQLERDRRIRWPREVVHGPWAEGSTMTTLVIERFD